VSESMFLDVLGMIAQPIAVGQGGIAPAIAVHEGAGEANQGRLQRLIRQGLSNGAGEIMMFMPGVIVHDD